MDISKNKTQLCDQMHLKGVTYKKRKFLLLHKLLSDYIKYENGIGYLHYYLKYNIQQ